MKVEITFSAFDLFHAEHPTPLKRPQISVLNKKKIKDAYGLNNRELGFVTNQNFEFLKLS